MLSTKDTPFENNIKVRLWFRGMHDAYKAMDELERLEITHAGDKDIVYLKTFLEVGPRGWGFLSKEKGTMAKLAVGNLTIEDCT